MKILLVALVTLVTLSAHAYTEDPHQAFNLAKNNTNQIAVTIIPTNDVQGTCDKESRKRGFGGFKYAVEACSFWEPSKHNNQCVIVLPSWANYHTVGHEMRHCMQGNYHK